MQPLTPTIKNLIIANVLVFIGVNIIGTANAIPEMLLLYPPSDDRFQFWQLVSHAFLHFELSHLAFNMLALYFLGPMVEMRLGAQKLLTLYFVAIAGAILFHFGYGEFQAFRLQGIMDAFVADPSLKHFNDFFMNIDLINEVHETKNGMGQVIARENAAAMAGKIQNDMVLDTNPEWAITQAKAMMNTVIQSFSGNPVLGASGAVSGVAAAFAVFYPNLKLSPLFLPFGFPAKYFVPFIFAVDLGLGFFNVMGDNVAHFAHVGGAVFGALLAWYFNKSTTPLGVNRWN